MNETAYAVREQYINLLGFDERCYFAHTESGMHQGLPGPVRVCPIIGREGFRRGAR